MSAPDQEVNKPGTRSPRALNGSYGLRFAFKKFFRASASLQFAVFNILSIGVISAYGTIVESRFDALTAQKLVYHSWWSYTVFSLFSWNLLAVMIDRWPWKKRHTGFVLAHIGILILMAGSLVTRYFGVDGSMRININSSSDILLLPEVDLMLWGSMDGENFARLSDPPYGVDFMVDPPTAEHPYDLSTGDNKIQVVDHIPYALRDSRIIETQEPSSGPAVRFQLSNDRVNLSEWILLGSATPFDSINLGPAKVIFSQKKKEPSFGNQIILYPAEDGKGLHYHIRKASDPNADKIGFIKPGVVVETGWMGLKLRVLQYMPQAKQQISYRPVKRPGPLTTSAIKVNFNGTVHEVGLNSVVKLFTDDQVLLIQYGNRQLPLGFNIDLKKFNVGRYQGTMRAASYESQVQYRDQQGQSHETVIAMNEPLKERGYTFYQSSFEEDDTGQPIASILSVNKDPGRPWKYLGSLLLVFGSLHLFYMKKKKPTAQGAANA